MSNETKPELAPFGAFHDIATGEYIIRDLTVEEIAALPQLTNEVPTTGV